jgi:hypothetical protein
MPCARAYWRSRTVAARSGLSASSCPALSPCQSDASIQVSIFAGASSHHNEMVSRGKSADLGMCKVFFGMAKEEFPNRHYFGTRRGFPHSCDWSWQETKPVDFYRTYYGVEVFEGAYPYAGMRLVPSWGGSRFEAPMPCAICSRGSMGTSELGDQPLADGAGPDPS